MDPQQSFLWLARKVCFAAVGDRTALMECLLIPPFASFRSLTFLAALLPSPPGRSSFYGKATFSCRGP